MTLTDVRTPLVEGPGPRRRGRTRRLVAVAAVLLVAVVGSWVAALRYSPLEHGSGILAFGRDRPGSTPLAESSIDNALGTEFRVTDPDVGDRDGVAFGLVNDGPFDVEVLDVGSPFPDPYFDEPRAFTSDAPGGSGAPYPALEPFILTAGGNRDVGVTVRVAGCPDGADERGDGGIVIAEVPVTWRFAGTTRVTRVPLAVRGSLHGIPQCAG